MRLTAFHDDSQAIGKAVAALTDLGFSSIKLSGGVTSKTALGHDARAADEFDDADDEFDTDEFDTIVCPGGQQGVDEYFYGKHQWRWVRVDHHKVANIKYVALYETVFDGEHQNAPGGRGLVIGYAPVENRKMAPSGDFEGKYCFMLGEIEPLKIPPGNLTLRNLRYTKLEKLLKAESLEELFKRRGGAHVQLRRPHAVPALQTRR